MEEIEVKVKKSAKSKPVTKESKEKVELPKANPIGWHTESAEEKKSETIIDRSEKQPNKIIVILRKLLALSFSFSAIVLLVSSLLALWSYNLVNSPEAFSKTFSPLISDSDVQKDITNKLTDQIMKNAPQSDLIKTLLPGQNLSGKSSDQIDKLLKTEVSAEINKVISSDKAATLWKSTIESAHSQALQIAKSSDTESVIDLSSSVQGLITLLQGTSLELQPKDIGADAGKISINAEDTKAVQEMYKAWSAASVALVVAAVIAIGLAVISSIKRRRTAMWLSFTTAFFMAPFAYMDKTVESMQKPSSTSEQDWQAIKSVYNITSTNLRTYALVIMIVALVIGITCFVYPFAKNRLSKQAE